MKMDPYKILGVPHGADQETIKKAYHKLAKKYHPDKYVDNPLKDLAEEKLKEINEAYDMLTSGNQGSGQNGAGANYGGANYGGANYGGANYGGKAVYNDVRRLIESGSLDEALNLLETKDTSTAEYNYLKGIIYYRKGWFSEAVKYINMAANMDPSNREYQFARANIQNRAGGYRDMSGGYGNMNTCDCCSNLLCADCLCEMCGGDLISCC